MSARREFVDTGVVAAVFLSFFGLYLWSAGPTLVPYRDAGEMVCVIQSLGVAHPPGYPLYALLAQTARLIPWANVAYRVNVFSALAAAIAIVFLFLLGRRGQGMAAGLVGALLLGLSRPFWELAAVSEMYSLGALCLIALVYVLVVIKRPLLAAFLWGLAMGVRMDLLLLLSVILILWWRPRGRHAILAAAAASIGVSIYFYSLVRSRANPWIDWGNPETFSTLLAAMSRRSYGGTLDLLSLSYGMGENFLDNLRRYGAHLVTEVGVPAVLFAAVGAIQLFRREPRRALALGTGLVVVGPLFLFLANLPLNPHAAAIVDASYLYPDCFLVFFALAGAGWMARDWSRRWWLALLFVLVPISTTQAFTRSVKRDHWAARDFSINCLRSAPADAVVVAQKDVPLFSLWNTQLVERRRRDVTVVPVGLSASSWYWEMRSRWPVALSAEENMKGRDGFARLRQRVAPRRLFVTMDADVSGSSGWPRLSRGLLSEPIPPGSPHPAVQAFVGPFLLNRGPRSIDDAHDFFTTDILTDLSRANHLEALAFVESGNSALAMQDFRRASALDPSFPQAWTDRGYLYLVGGDPASAEEAYLAGADLSERMLRLAATYRSLPTLVSGIKLDVAVALDQAGVAADRAGARERARSHYRRSIESQPTAQAHYNLAVTYWNQDWNAVREHVDQALRLNPGMPEARALYNRIAARPSGFEKGSRP